MDLTTRLLLQNRAWADEMTSRDPAFFENLVSGQQPRAFWIGCADSRVPAERITKPAGRTRSSTAASPTSCGRTTPTS